MGAAMGEPTARFLSLGAGIQSTTLQTPRVQDFRKSLEGNSKIEDALEHRSGCEFDGMSAGVVWSSSPVVAATDFGVLAGIGVAQRGDGLGRLVCGGFIGDRYPQPVLVVFHRPVEQAREFGHGLPRWRGEYDLDGVSFTWPALDEVEAAVPPQHQIEFLVKSVAHEPGHGPACPFPGSVGVGAGQFGLVLVGVEPQHPQVDVVGLGVAPVVPDDLVVVAANAGVERTAAAFGAGRLGETNLVRLAGGKQWAAWAEQTIRIFSRAAVEHRADDVLAVDEDDEFDLPPVRDIRVDDVEGQPVGHGPTLGQTVSHPPVTSRVPRPGWRPCRTGQDRLCCFGVVHGGEFGDAEDGDDVAEACAGGHPLRGELFLHRQRVPLDEVVLRPRIPEPQDAPGCGPWPCPHPVAFGRTVDDGPDEAGVA